MNTSNIAASVDAVVVDAAVLNLTKPKAKGKGKAKAKVVGTTKVLTAAQKAKAKKSDKAAKVLAADNAKIDKAAAKVIAAEAKVEAAKLDDAENYAKAIALVPVKAMNTTAKKYSALVVQAQDKLETLKAIGEQFCSIKVGFEVGVNLKGETTYDDNAFSRCIKTTPLSVISKRDRSDCVWLYNNWSAIADFKKDGVTSNSITYLRKLMVEADKKAKALAKAAEELLNGTPTPPVEAADSDAIEGEYTMVDGEAKAPQTIEALCTTIQGLVGASEHTMEAVLLSLVNSCKSVKLVTK